MERSKGFLRYQIHHGKKKDSEYAYFCHAERISGIKCNNDIYLGKVINKEKVIFFNKEKGAYIYKLEEGYKDLNDLELAQINNQYKNKY
jgi:hypothetical protein